MAEWKSVGITLAVALTGAGLFMLLGLPLPFLLGPMLACLIAALCGIRLNGMPRLATLARAVLGVAIGASVTPEVLAKLPAMTASVALVPVYIAVIAAVGIPFFVRICGFDRPTAFFAAMPGGAVDMTLFGQVAGANVRQISLVHATRLLVLVMITPFILSGIYGADLNGRMGATMHEMSVWQLAIMALAALIGLKVATALHVFGAAIIGPMLLTIPLTLTGVISERPPMEVLVAAQLLIGIGIGVCYVGITLTEARQTLLAGTAYVLILGTIAAIVTEAATLLGLAAPTEAFLSFAPGGQAEMSMLAIVTGADAGFVVVHHLLRVLLVIVISPFFLKFLKD